MRVYSIESHVGVMTMAYEVTIGLIPNCTCPNFFSMLTNLKKKEKFVPCKHLYFILKTRMFYNHKIDDFINQPTLNINEVKKICKERFKLVSTLQLHKHIQFSYHSMWLGPHVFKLSAYLFLMQFGYKKFMSNVHYNLVLNLVYNNTTNIENFLACEHYIA